MKQLFLASMCFAMMGIGAAAQQAPRSSPQRPNPQVPPSQQGEPNDAQSVTLTGCLTKGNSSGEYVLADQRSGDKVRFQAPDKIEPYVNQTVQLTGTVAQGQFQPEAVKRISASCEAAQPRR